METSAELSYVDILKLCIPFLFALVLVWVRHYYVLSSERRNKNLHLWRGIKEEFDNCVNGKKALNQTLERLKNNKIIFFALDIPCSLTDYAKRLAELECKTSYLYSDYVSKVDMVRKGHELLQSLLSKAAFQDLSATNTAPRIKAAIRSQIDALKGDIMLLAEAEILLMNYIASKAHIKEKKKTLQYLEETIESARNIK